MGLEDRYCPFCGTPNTMALQHHSDMERYQRQYRETHESVMEKTSLMQKHGAWLILLTIMLVVTVIGTVIYAKAWDIGYSIRQSNGKRNYSEDCRVMEGYLQEGDYSQFAGYYNANSYYSVMDNEYDAVASAAEDYTRLIKYVSTLRSPSDLDTFREDYFMETCEYTAQCIQSIFNVEKLYGYRSETLLTDDKMVYIHDIQDRAGVIAKAYFGLSDDDVDQITRLSEGALGEKIAEGVRK